MRKFEEFFNEDASLFDKFFNWKMKEGLIISIDYDMFKDKLSDLLNKYDVVYTISNTNEFVKLNVNLKYTNHKIFSKKIQELLNIAGYFIANLIDIKIDDKIDSILDSKNSEFIYFFQKRFDVPQNTPERLFHATTIHYYEKIKRTGIEAKTQKMISNDIERVYLTDNLVEAMDFCTQKRFFYKKKNSKIELFNMNIDKWVILEIDIYSIPDIKLYKDEKMDNSYYTYDFIPFYAFKVVKEINF